MRVQQQFTRIQNGGPLARFDEVGKKLPLPFEARIRESGLRHLNSQRWQHFARVAYQEDIARLSEKAEVEIDEMMRHMLDEQSPEWVSALIVDELAHDSIAVAIHRSQDFFPARMIGARHAKIVTV